MNPTPGPPAQDRRRLILVGFLALSLLPLWWVVQEERRPAAVAAVPAAEAPDAPVATLPPPAPVPLSPEETDSAPASLRPNPRQDGSPLAAELNSPGGTAQRDVAVLHEMLRQYLRLLHHRQGLPIGNDTDLLRALTGQNPMQLVVLPPQHPAVGADRRLRDRWGTPYFIHPRGNSAYEIRSAGPDRKLFTADDLVANPAPAPVAIEEQ